MTEKKIQAELFRIRRSACRLMMPNYSPRGWWECDMLAVTKAGYWNEFEIKLSLQDYAADWSKQKGSETKHGRLAASLERDSAGPKTFSFVMPAELAELVEPPDYAGVIGVEARGRWLGFRVYKPAPRLHSEKFNEKQTKQLLTSAYWRYWNLRQ